MYACMCVLTPVMSWTKKKKWKLFSYARGRNGFLIWVKTLFVVSHFFNNRNSENESSSSSSSSLTFRLQTYITRTTTVFQPNEIILDPLIHPSNCIIQSNENYYSIINNAKFHSFIIIYLKNNFSSTSFTSHWIINLLI